MSAPRKKLVPENLPADMAPRPFPVEGSGLFVFATHADLHSLQSALDEEGCLAVLQRLMRGDHLAIAQAAWFCLMNSDRTPWVGDVDSLPIASIELGQLLADAVHRRMFGTPLTLEVMPDA